MRKFPIALAVVAIACVVGMAFISAPDAAAHAGAGVLTLAGMMAPLSLGLDRPLLFMDARSIDDLLAERQELFDACQAILDAADESGDDVSEEDLATIGEHQAAIKKLDRLIDIRQQLAESTAPPAPQREQNRRTTPEVMDRNPGGGPPERRVPATARDSARWGFRSFGEFAMATRYHAINNHEHELVRRLMASAAGNQEALGVDGGFLVPPEMRREIWQKVSAIDNLLTRTDQLVTGSNAMTFPKDETTPWDTTRGVQVYWESEGGSMDRSKAAFELAQARLAKVTALVPVTDEQLEDAPGLESYLRSRVPVKIASKLNTAIVRGTGVGQPLGILRAPSLISVAIETSQVADSIWYPNINKMWSRMWAPLRRNAIWLINQDIEPQLEAMEFSPGSTVPIPVYLPPGGAADRPYATLKGRPVIPVEPCSTLGDQGDIILVDLMQYMTLTKGQDIKTDVSIHLYFDTGQTAFRFVLRINGQPWWGSTIAPENGTTTRSWAVTLDAR